MTIVESALDRFLADPSRSVAGGRVGLLTNPCGVDARFHSTIDRCRDHPDIELVALFGPEHGVRGGAQAGEHVPATRDPKTGLPIHSLYGETRTPTAEMLAGIDVLLVDLQDIGVRYTTYLSTLAHALTACAGNGVEIVIVDRPNPLGGVTVRGNILEHEFESFVGIHGIPILHGLTIGEFGRLWASDKDLSPPRVIEMKGWDRNALYDQSGLPWVFPSPNLPTLDSVLIYPGTCLIEGTNLSEGRGTTRPFEIIGAPWIDPDVMVNELDRLMLPGIAFRPMYFVPAFSKHAGNRCGGAQVYVTDRAALDSVRFGVALLGILKKISPDDFSWLPPSTGRHFIDLLTGTDQVRLLVDRGEDSGALMERWDTDAANFENSRQGILLY